METEIICRVVTRCECYSCIRIAFLTVNTRVCFQSTFYCFLKKTEFAERILYRVPGSSGKPCRIFFCVIFFSSLILNIIRRLHDKKNGSSQKIMSFMVSDAVLKIYFRAPFCPGFGAATPATRTMSIVRSFGIRLQIFLTEILNTIFFGPYNRHHFVWLILMGT